MSEFVWTGEEELHFTDGTIKKVTELTTAELKILYDQIAKIMPRSKRLNALKKVQELTVKKDN